MEHISGPVARILGSSILASGWQAQFEKRQKIASECLAAYLAKPSHRLLTEYERCAEAAQIAAYRAHCAGKLADVTDD